MSRLGAGVRRWTVVTAIALSLGIAVVSHGEGGPARARNSRSSSAAIVVHVSPICCFGDGHNPPVPWSQMRVCARGRDGKVVSAALDSTGKVRLAGLSVGKVTVWMAADLPPSYIRGAPDSVFVVARADSVIHTRVNVFHGLYR